MIFNDGWRGHARFVKIEKQTYENVDVPSIEIEYRHLMTNTLYLLFSTCNCLYRPCYFIFISNVITPLRNQTGIRAAVFMKTKDKITALTVRRIVLSFLTSLRRLVSILLYFITIGFAEYVAIMVALSATLIPSCRYLD